MRTLDWVVAGQGFAVAMWNVVTVSLRQQIVPAGLLGRVNSVYRMLGWGLMPLGAVAGGFVAGIVTVGFLPNAPETATEAGRFA